MEKLGSTLIRSGRTVVNADREPGGELEGPHGSVGAY